MSTIFEFQTYSGVRNPYWSQPLLKTYFPPEVESIRNFVCSYCTNANLKCVVDAGKFCVSIMGTQNILVTGELDDEGKIHGPYNINSVVTTDEDSCKDVKEHKKQDDNSGVGKVRLSANFVHGKATGPVVYVTFIHVTVYSNYSNGVPKGYRYEYYTPNINKFLNCNFDPMMITTNNPNPIPDILTLSFILLDDNNVTTLYATLDPKDVVSHTITNFDSPDIICITTYDNKDRVIGVEIRDKNTYETLEKYSYSNLTSFEPIYDPPSLSLSLSPSSTSSTSSTSSQSGNVIITNDDGINLALIHGGTFQRQGYLGVSLIPEPRMVSKTLLLRNCDYGNGLVQDIKISVLYSRKGHIHKLYINHGSGGTDVLEQLGYNK